MIYKDSILRKLFYGVFACSFLLLFGSIFLASKSDLPVYFLAILLWAACAFFAWRLINHNVQKLTMHKKTIVFITLVLVFCIQLYFGILLATDPIFDFEAVFRGAQAWASTGSLGEYQDYFYIFPNNLGSTLLLKNLFSAASFLGIHNDYLVGTLFNILLTDLTFLFVFLICDRLLGTAKAMLCFYLCVTFLPLYFFAPVFYTDTLSMVFAPLFYYLYVRSQKLAPAARIFIFALMGITLAVGAGIKFTVVIVAAAVLLEIFATHQVKRNLLPIAALAAAAITVTMAFQGYIYSTVLDKATARERNVPYVHWIMMGLKGNGTYNGEDYQFTYSFEDPAKRTEAIVEEIENRLQNYGVPGFFKHAAQKSMYIFGNGTYNVSEFLDDNPQHDTLLHKFGLTGGKYYRIFFILAQAAHIGMFLAAVFAAAAAMLKPHKYPFPAVPFLSLFGLLLFLIIWEANPRYLLHFVPMLFLCAAWGMDAFFHFFNRSVRYFIRR